MRIIYTKIDNIIPFKRNPKKHPHYQVKAIAKSIEKYGFYSPLVIDKDDEIIIGHGRYEAAKLLKLKEVPIVKLEALSDDDVRGLRILDNKIAESDWDLELLKEELETISNFDWKEFNIDFDELTALDPIDFGKLGFDEDQLGKKTEAFLHGTIKQIVLYFDNDQYEEVVEKLNTLREKLNLESNTEVFLELLKSHENNSS